MDNFAKQHIEKEIKRAAQVVREGGVILYPTDTIWGIGCDPRNDEAIKKILRIKRRTEPKSLIILVCETSSIKNFVNDPLPIAFDLMEQWKKPLTIVFPRVKNIFGLVNHKDSIGIRVTKERFSYNLLKELQYPLVSTSANISGTPSPVSYKSIAPWIKENVDYIVDYRRDNFTDMKASTIIKIHDNGSFEVLRP